jgi:hypothetical protein
MNKICSKCKIEKPISDFISCKGGKYGVRGECKTCKIKYDNEHKRKYPSRYKEIYLNQNIKRKLKNKEWRLANKEKRRKQLNEYMKKNPEKRRANKLRALYGISSQEYNLLISQQSNRCAICGKIPCSENKDRRLYVDHDHKSKLVRGLLCQHCNTGLGFFKDDAGLLSAAITYLEAFKLKNE